ncbi:MAG: ADP-ribosylglycohydrolase family protein [Chthoniobacteraceae bacterium]
MSKIDLESRVMGGWLGKSAGGTLGLPAEGKTERLNYRFYDPLPTVVPPNDDLELQLVWLDRMERHRGPLTLDVMGDAWLSHIHYMWDEYGRARWNLRRGVQPGVSGVYDNPFASGMGSPIRSEIWAIISAGNPDLAERFARLDSMIDHGAEGITGEVFFASVQAMILDGAPLGEALEEGMKRVDAGTETRRALDLVMSCFRCDSECWAAREDLLRAHGNENFTHAPLNVALTLWALLYGRGDFSETLLLAVNGGYDTDCTAASAGAILGMSLGTDALPSQWIEPLGDSLAIGPGIRCIRAPKGLRELTERSIALRDRAAELAPVFPSQPLSAPSAGCLPGCVEITSGNLVVSWANGELPPEIKALGGGAWEWQSGDGLSKTFRVIALARDGLRLWIDGRLVIKCPPGVPYVPATHRAPESACALFRPSRAVHEIRVELNSANPWQAASVLLADASLHLAPWSAVDLPYCPILPPVL